MGTQLLRRNVPEYRATKCPRFNVIRYFYIV
jgi:hypothetical protein